MASTERFYVAIAARDARVFHALAHPKRLLLLYRLKGGQRSITALVPEGSTRQAITAHLGVLERAGLVTSKRVSRERHFAITERGRTLTTVRTR